MQCSNKLRQLGMAAHNHSDATRHFPVSVSPFPEGFAPAPRRDGRGWIVGTLPYIEQAALHGVFARHFGQDFLSGQGLRHPDLF